MKQHEQSYLKHFYGGFNIITQKQCRTEIFNPNSFILNAFKQHYVEIVILCDFL